MASSHRGHDSLEAIATVEEQQGSFNAELIRYITNDADVATGGSLIINFDRSTYHRNGGAITIRAGETLEDVSLACSALFYRSSIGNVPFRAFGVI